MQDNLIKQILGSLVGFYLIFNGTGGSRESKPTETVFCIERNVPVSIRDFLRALAHVSVAAMLMTSPLSTMLAVGPPVTTPPWPSRSTPHAASFYKSRCKRKQASKQTSA